MLGGGGAAAARSPQDRLVRAAPVRRERAAPTCWPVAPSSRQFPTKDTYSIKTPARPSAARAMDQQSVWSQSFLDVSEMGGSVLLDAASSVDSGPGYFASPGSGQRAAPGSQRYIALDAAHSVADGDDALESRPTGFGARPAQVAYLWLKPRSALRGVP